MYPDDSIQAYVGEWWVTEETHDVRRGRILRAFVPHVFQVPMVLTLVGRSSPTDHSHATYKLEPLKTSQPPKLPRIPIAAVPLFEGDVLAAYKAKKRPVLVISAGGPEISRSLTSGSPKSQVAPTMLVAPYYGAEAAGRRAGFKGEFTSRIRRSEYPQYMWDRLPIGGSTDESILRLDQIQPVPRHPDAFEWTHHCLSDDALMILDEWLHWLFEGDLRENAILRDFREGLLDLERGP